MLYCLQVNTLPCWRGLEYNDCIPCKGVKPPAKKSVLGMTLLTVRLQFWTCGECSASFFYHYSQVYSDLEYKYLLGSHLWVKLICLKIICNRLDNLIPYNCKLFVLKTVTWNYDCLQKIIINIQYQVESYQRLKKWDLILPCLTLR